MENKIHGKTFTVILNVAFGVLGLWLLFDPTSGISLYRFFAGTVLIISGITFFLMYHNDEEKNVLKLLEGIIFCVLGVLFLVNMSVSSMFLGLVLLGWVAFEMFINVGIAFSYHKYKLNGWWIFLIYALALLGLGIYMAFHLSASGKTLVMLVGVVVFVQSVIKLVDTLLYKEKYTQLSIEQDI